MRRTFRRLGASLLLIGTVLVLVSVAGADTVGPITFETSQGYVVGNIHMQPLNDNYLPNGKWEKSGPYDAQVVSTTAYPDASGYNFVGQALRISDAVTSGSFGDQTFSPGLADEAGETIADNAGLS